MINLMELKKFQKLKFIELIKYTENIYKNPKIKN